MKSVILIALFLTPTIAKAFDNNTMYAHYINVGQADSTLLEFSCGALLVDAGAQDDQHIDKLTSYLDDFFSDRPDLNNTINTIFITHNHIDHTRALREVVERYKVNGYIGTGHSGGIGTGDPNWVRANAAARSITVRIPSESEVYADDTVAGTTGPTIDPLACDGTDPVITLLSGAFTHNPGWSHSEFDNKNNHSLVIRADFGEASLLFSGDLEDEAIDHLVELYGDDEGGPLDVDVYQVGHHGSHNGTTLAFLSAMTPEIAIFSVGNWDFGKASGERFSTYAYGHPRKSVVDQLNLAIKKRRSSPIDMMVATGVKRFESYRLKKKIYGTGWDGNIKVRAKSNGTFRVTINQ